MAAGSLDDEDSHWGRIDQHLQALPRRLGLLFSRLLQGEMTGVSYRERRLGDEEGQEMLVLRRELLTPFLLRQIDVAQAFTSIADGCAEERPHRWMVGRETYGARMLSQVCQPQGLLCLLEPAQNAQTLWEVANAFPLFGRDTVGDELLDTVGDVKHRQRAVPGTRQVTRPVHDSLQYGGQVQAGGYLAAQVAEQRRATLQTFDLLPQVPQLLVSSAIGSVFHFNFGIRR